VFFHVQFPFSDLRAFVKTNPEPVASPSWPAPIVDVEFVRSFGCIRRRPSGGLTGWIGEAAFCQIRRAAVFRARDQDFRLAFRRLYFDGVAAGKFEFGLRLRPNQLNRPLERDINRLLDLTFDICQPKGGTANRRLLDIGAPLTRLYGYSTSKIMSTGGPDEPIRVVRAEGPTVVIEMTAEEIKKITLPGNARTLAVSPLAGVELHFWQTTIEGRTIAFWCIVLGSWQGEARLLRTLLLRLSAEHHALRRVLQAVGSRQIDAARRDDVAQRVQNYINDVSYRVLRCEAKVTPFSSEIEQFAISAFECAGPGETAALIARMQALEFRGNIIRKIETYTAKSVITVNVGSLDMGTTYNINNSNNVVINSTLTNSQLTVGRMAAGTDDEKANLKDLLQQLADEVKKAPQEQTKQAETVMKRADQLVTEAAEDEPDPSILDSLGEALKKAADFLKGAVPATVTIASQIVSLIAAIHGL